MNHLKFTNLIIFIFYTASSMALDTASTKYFPLAVGNIFVYIFHYNNSGSQGSIIMKGKIMKDTVILNKRYYYSIDFPYFTNIWVRTDSITGSLYKYDSSNNCKYYQYETMIDSLSSQIFDTVNNCGDTYFCTDTNNRSLFGVDLKSKKYGISYYFPPPGYASVHYSKIFIQYRGLSNYYENINGRWFYYIGEYNLNGCVLDGIVYGDTSSSPSYISENKNVPKNTYALFQNYPNPFNPVTVIRYQLAVSSYVQLKVFDISGKEVEELVKQKQMAGEYKIEFDGSSLASGVYFYRLVVSGANPFESKNFTLTKGMVLIK